MGKRKEAIYEDAPRDSPSRGMRDTRKDTPVKTIVIRIPCIKRTSIDTISTTQISLFFRKRRVCRSSFLLLTLGCGCTQQFGEGLDPGVPTIRLLVCLLSFASALVSVVNDMDRRKDRTSQSFRMKWRTPARDLRGVKMSEECLTPRRNLAVAYAVDFQLDLPSCTTGLRSTLSFG